MNTAQQSQATANSEAQRVRSGGEASAVKAYNTDVPFNQLRRSASNVRRSGRETAQYCAGVEALAASIFNVWQQTGQGILQNLVVHANGEGFDVAAGGRRFDAIALLIEQGKLAEDYPTPCLIIGDDAVTSASLTENVMREAMHPADEFDAFKVLTEQGWTLDRIADSFGVSTLVVERRLKLRAAAPALIEEYRLGALTTEQLIALCATDDHERQLEVWERVREQQWNNDPASIRRAVIYTEVEASKDPRVAFIGGVEVYEQAGGGVRRDLFAEDGQGVLLSDSALLDVLVEAKLQELADQVQAEGWGWVEVWPKFDYTQFDRLGRAPKKLNELSAGSFIQLEALEKELEDVQTAIESHLEAGDDEQAQELDERNDELEAEILKIQVSREGYAPEVMGHAGAIISMHYGSLRIDRGLVRTADRANVTSALGEGERLSGGRETEPAGRKGDTISDALRRSLLGHRNLAAQFVTATNAHAAKVLLVCQFITEARHDWSGAPTDLSIGNGAGSRTSCSITDEAGLAKQETFTAQGEQLIAALPKDNGDLWDSLAALLDAELDTLLAFAVARSVSLSTEPHVLTDKYVQALSLKMEDHFVPTVGNYLGRVSKDLIIEALTEAQKIEGDADLATLRSLKKAALATEAQTRLAGTGWVPSLIRTPQVKPVALKGKAKTKRADKAATAKA